MTIVTTMCKLLFAMLIGFYLFKKDILTKEVNAKLSSLIVQITCPCIILNSLSTVSHEDTGMILKLFLAGVVMYVIFPILSWIITKIMRVPAHLRGTYMCMLIFSNNSFMGYPVVASKETLLDYVIHNEIDEVFIAYTDGIKSDTLKEWVSELEQMGVIVDVNIDAFDLLSHGNKNLNQVGKYAVVTFARNVISTRQLIMKRLLDIAGALVGMVILGVATVFVAPAIKLESPGPVFFGQTRIGKNGRRFTFYKFRSMYQDAEQRKKELMAKNEVHGLMFKMENDPRITKVGRFIRKTSIDELPQFWNILKGDMSLVGTRPPTVDEFERYEAKHKCRLSMTPGLTGLWQVSGRSDIKDFDEVVQLDMQYIDNWSILKDIKILLLTVGIVITGKGSR